MDIVRGIAGPEEPPPRPLVLAFFQVAADVAVRQHPQFFAAAPL